MRTVASVVLVFGVTLSAQDWPIGKGVNRYGKQEEAALGAKMVEEVRKQVTPVESVGVREYGERLGNQLAEQMPGGYEYTFSVYSHSTFRKRNSTREPRSIMGGHIFVPASLILAARSEAEFAGMLAHAMAHVAGRHSSRLATRGELVNPASIPLFGLGTWEFGGDETLIPLGFRKFMRTFELEADGLAARAMARAGYDPAALVRYIGRMQADSTAQEEVISTLPARGKRLAALEQVIAGLGERAYSSSGGFQRIQDELRDKPQYTFGTTVVSTSGFRGRVYHLKKNTGKLPRFRRKRSVGTIYTDKLNVWPQRFDEGFPGLSDRFEWFGIDYTGQFWIEEPGEYRFSLLSDDGARLSIDDQELIDNDGAHVPQALSASAYLSRGVHKIRVSYFQGPRFTVALVLAIGAPGEAWRIFDTDEFPPPRNESEWVEGEISDVRHSDGNR